MKRCSITACQGPEESLKTHLACCVHVLLLRPIELDVANMMQVVRACVALHNFLLSKKDTNYAQHDSMDEEDELGNVTPGSWRNAIEEVVCNIKNRYA